MDPALLFESHANFELEGEELGRRILAAGVPCTAIVAGTDRLALGILSALKNAGLSVPKDLARFVKNAEPLPQRPANLKPEPSPETCSVVGAYGGTPQTRLITLEFPEEYYPERITIDVPVEVKAAALAFEFKDLKRKE